MTHAHPLRFLFVFSLLSNDASRGNECLSHPHQTLLSNAIHHTVFAKEWIVDGCHLCVFFLLSSLHRLSFVSVVFDFNDSLNDVVPASPMLLSVDVKRNGKERFADECHLCVFFLLYSHLRWNSASVVFDFSDSLNDFAPASSMLLSVCVKRKEKSELLMDAICVSSFVCIHSSDQAQ